MISVPTVVNFPVLYSKLIHNLKNFIILRLFKTSSFKNTKPFLSLFSRLETSQDPSSHSSYHSENWLKHCYMENKRENSHRVPRCALPATLVPPTTLQVRSDPFPCPLRKLWKLPGTTVDDRLYLLLRLLRDGHDTVQVLVDEQPDEHL